MKMIENKDILEILKKLTRHPYLLGPEKSTIPQQCLIFHVQLFVYKNLSVF